MPVRFIVAWIRREMTRSTSFQRHPNQTKYHVEREFVKRLGGLLAAWNELGKLQVNSGLELLRSFEGIGIQKIVHNKSKFILKNLRELLDDFSEHGIDKLVSTLNPLDVLLKDYFPNEDNHSDLMAALLDPSRKHGLGVAGINALLDIVTQIKRNKNLVCDAIRNEIKATGTVRVNVRTRRDSLAEFYL